MITIALSFLIIPIILIAYDQIYRLSKTWQTYIIEKGKHFSRFNWTRLLLNDKSHLQFSVVFSKGCVYTLEPSVDQKDVNKLYGLGWGIKGPLHNSFRIGWRWDNADNRIEVLLYVHDQGTRFIDSIGRVGIGEEVSFLVFVQDKTVVVYYYRDQKPTQTRSYTFKKKISWIRYRLFPYFGGNQTAPDQVKILIKEGKI